MIGRLWSTSTKVVLHSLMTTRPGVHILFPRIKINFLIRSGGRGEATYVFYYGKTHHIFVLLFFISLAIYKWKPYHYILHVLHLYILYIYILFFFRHLIMFIHYLINHKTILLYVKKLMKNNKCMILYDSVLN